MATAYIQYKKFSSSVKERHGHTGQSPANSHKEGTRDWSIDPVSKGWGHWLPENHPVLDVISEKAQEDPNNMYKYLIEGKRELRKWS